MADKTTAVAKKELITSLEERVKQMQESSEMHFPANYSPQNALKSAWLMLQEIKDSKGNAALDVCTPASIQNALLTIVVSGLSPLKKQIYMIVYGNKLNAQRSYFGTVKMLKSLEGVTGVVAQVVYKDDIFKFSIQDGTKKIEEHEQTLESIDGQIIAAYATIKTDQGDFTEIMTMKQIQTSWNKSKTQQAVHKEFPDQMAMKTVINRACKLFVNTSDDSDLLIGAFHDSEKFENDTPEEVINREANKTTLKMDVPPKYKVEEQEQEEEQTPTNLMGDELPADEF